MANEYLGMRWRKTDFQVQTPEDNRHWADDDLRLAPIRRPMVDGQPDESDIQEKAKIFLRRCHALDLEVVGITDHNFSEKLNPRDWFLTHLVEQNKTVSKEFGREPLSILPGFEVDIGYHVLCLFDPARRIRDVVRVNLILTTVGREENRRFRGGIPQPLRDNDQTVSLKKLLEVVQRSGGVVIGAHADQHDGILNEARNIEDYKLPGLLAVEVTAFPMAPKFQAILSGKNKDWSRLGRQPAYVQSSDAKSLKTDDKSNPLPNSLGYRYTWVKCSKPSVASLRQAFLDGASRLRLQELSPSDSQTHPRIVSVKCVGLKFLADQEIFFSPNLNTLIGGRGTGKSTVLELLRFAFGRDKGDTFSDSIQAKFKRVRATFTEDLEIQVRWQSLSEQVDVISLKSNGDHLLLEGEAHDFLIYLKHLPVQFFSQQQLSDLTDVDGGRRLLLIIDDACAAEIQVLKGQEETLKAEILQLFATQDQSNALAAEIKTIKQELLELNRQWKARKDVQEEAKNYQFADSAGRYFEQVKAQFSSDLEQVRQLAKKLDSPGILNDGKVEAWPMAEWFNFFTLEAKASRDSVAFQLKGIETYIESEISRLFEKNAEWQSTSVELERVKAEFLQACHSRGLQPQDVARLQEIDRARLAKQNALDAREIQQSLLEPKKERLPIAMAQLHELWDAQFKLRQKTASEISAKTEGSIRVVIRKMSDSSQFEIPWKELAPDGRSRLGRVWDYIGERIFDDFRRRALVGGGAYSIWLHIKEILTDVVPTPLTLLEYKGDLKTHLVAQTHLWRQARLTRVEEDVDIELFRIDGSSVGSVQSRALSEGQRNTAVLNLLLAKGEGPIIIDQPEDELDSNFIYHELVPLLRRIKNKRQLIIATHNANLPVNADADLVYALKVAEGRGIVLAEGGLDNSETTEAVLDIMEGSAEAFKRRLAKYHF
jgi:ABC-type enterochelin transport system ATPase subunit